MLNHKLGIKNLKSFLQLLENPQNDIKNIIHIAGTNGKGSTLSFLASLLKAQNKKVGLYTSPHLICVRERFRLNDDLISEQDFQSFMKIVEERNKVLPSSEQLTYFEKLTAVAFLYYAREQTDFLLLETGLGGRFDATNIIEKPLISLITNISLEHQDYLGDTIEKIAFEKACILKENVPFITTVSNKKALKVIKERAKKINAKEIPLGNYKIDNAKLGLKGRHQRINAKLALTAFDYIIKSNNPIDYEAIYQEQSWIGRFQEFKISNKSVILDAAHNPAGAEVLKKALDDYYPNTKKIWLLGFLKSKDAVLILKKLISKGDKIIFTKGSTGDFWDPDELTQIIHKIYDMPALSFDNYKDALDIFKTLVKEKDLGIITGSIYMLGDILPNLFETYSDF